MDWIAFPEISMRLTLAVRLKSPWFTAVIELFDTSTLLRRTKWVKLAGTEVSSCPGAAMVSSGTGCCGMSNWARTVAIMLSLTALPVGHERVRVVLLPSVSGHTNGAIEGGFGHSQTIGFMALRKGVLFVSWQVGAPLTVGM